MTGPRISYVGPASIKDAAMLAELDRCRREGTPRPESQAVRAHVPAVFWSFANSWRDVFKNGVADHAIKELCRLYVSRSVKCEYCGNQRSIKAAKPGVGRGGLPRSPQLREVHPLQRQAEGGAGLGRGHHLGPARRRQAVGAPAPHFSEPELVEIGYFIALTMGQQRWLRTLDIEHHQVLAGTDASMAPGFETEAALRAPKPIPDTGPATRQAPEGGSKIGCKRASARIAPNCASCRLHGVHRRNAPSPYCALL